VGTPSCPGLHDPAPGSASAACTIHTPTVPAAAGTDQSVQAHAESQGLLMLDRLFGRYLRGEIAVYRGSASARDNQNLSSGFPDAPDEVLSANGTALAQLDAQRLAITSPCENKTFDVQQQSGAAAQTTVSGIGTETSPSGLSGGCLDCVPDLSTPPETMAWTNAEAAGGPNDYPNGAGAFHSISSANLRRESPCSLTWDELVVLNAGRGSIDGFVHVGNEMVWHASGTITTKQPTGRVCDGMAVMYTIDLYVNLANLSDYGTRNFQTGSTEPVCGA
jgi:hypothetical protein